jgi:hypothetical protein
VVFVLYAALLYAGIYVFKAQGDVVGLAVYSTVVTAVLIAVVALKGERPARWRWGKE